MGRREVFLAALAIGGASCSSAQPPAPTTSEPARGLTREPDPLIAAQVSVAYHAAHGPPRGRAEGVILPLAEAAAILKGAPAIERSRAVARLHTARAPELEAEKARALAVLGVPAVRLDHLLGSQDEGAGATPLRVAIDRELGVSASRCGAELIESVGTVKDGIITVHTAVAVRRPLEELRAVVDPQSWDCCGPKYFSDACIPEVDEDGLVFIPGSVAPVCAESTREAPLPRPGSRWSGPLYERFRVAVAGRDAVYFNTVIDIAVRTGPGAPNHVVDFSLNRSLGGEIGWSNGACDIDEGAVTLTPQSDGRVRVDVTKRLRLQFATPEETALWTEVTALTMPIAGESLETSICCDPGACPHP